MTVEEMRVHRPGVYASLRKRRYPAGAKTCDLALDDLPEWSLEVKLARVRRDNGTYVFTDS